MSDHDDQLRQALRDYTAGIAATCTVPPASAVWLHAERRSRRLALKRAERPLRIMQALGLLYAALAAGWLLYHSDALRQIAAMRDTSLALASVSVLLVVAGCWTMLREGRRRAS